MSSLKYLEATKTFSVLNLAYRPVTYPSEKPSIEVLSSKAGYNSVVASLRRENLSGILVRGCTFMIKTTSRRETFSTASKYRSQALSKLDTDMNQQNTSLLVGTCGLLEQLGSHPSSSLRSIQDQIHATWAVLVQVKNSCSS